MSFPKSLFKKSAPKKGVTHSRTFIHLNKMDNIGETISERIHNGHIYKIDLFDDHHILMMQIKIDFNMIPSVYIDNASSTQLIQDNVSNTFRKEMIKNVMGMSFDYCENRCIVLHKEIPIANISIDVLNRQIRVNAKKPYYWQMTSKINKALIGQIQPELLENPLISEPLQMMQMYKHSDVDVDTMGDMKPKLSFSG